ncbi:MAG: Crp/Fnr family transcriptional regulator, partial [Gammaproteobacteria bacterium]
DQLVQLARGTVLYESGITQQHIYFPTDSVASLQQMLADGSSTEVSIVGNEGATGFALFMGGETTTIRAVVQSAGCAYRLAGASLKEEFERHGELLLILLRHTQALITEVSQSAVCSRHHTIDQQLCRRLLRLLDRSLSPNLILTQALIANMLGVRREGVSEAASGLQRIGAIRCRRGQITILDRRRLEELSCECYGVVKKETSRLLAATGDKIAIRLHTEPRSLNAGPSMDDADRTQRHQREGLYSQQVITDSRLG